MEGTIKSVVVDKGYGFIAVPKSKDYFFHISELDPSLAFDELLIERRVTFDVGERDGKPRAVNVRAAS